MSEHSAGTTSYNRGWNERGAADEQAIKEAIDVLENTEPAFWEATRMTEQAEWLRIGRKQQCVELMQTIRTYTLKENRMNEMKHTPTPWKIDLYNSTLVVSNHPKKDGKYTVARTDGTESVYNAAFIVRAANAHDDLLALLKQAVDIFNETCDCGACGPCDHLRLLDQAIEKIEASS